MVIIRKILLGLALLGLVMAPAGRAAVALAAHSEVSMNDQVGMGDMPCCPDEAPVSCAKDCPFMALCSGGTMLCSPAHSGLLVPHSLATLNIAANDEDVAGQIYGPPPRPPKL